MAEVSGSIPRFALLERRLPRPRPSKLCDFVADFFRGLDFCGDFVTDLSDLLLDY